MKPQFRRRLLSISANNMRWLRHFLLASWLLVLIGITSAEALENIPALSGHVVDKVGLLSPTAQTRLEKMLGDYETRTGSQIALLVVASTFPETIEQFSIRVAEAWKLGRKNVDDGVILLVAKDNPKSLHRLRIESGRGVQGSLTDLQSKRILQEVVAPYFQRNDFDGGMQAGVSAIFTLLDREQLPAPPVVHRAAATPDTWSSALPFLLFIAFIALSIWLRNRQGRGALQSGGWGNGAGVILGSAISTDRGNTTAWPGASSGGSVTGGGGGFDGGGASGDW